MQNIRDRSKETRATARHGAMTRVAGLAALTATLAVMGFLASGSISLSAAGTNASLALSKTKLGMVLVNSKGHTLYIFAKDKNGKSVCTGKCATFWPPALRKGKPTTGKGVKATLLGTTKRSNKTVQLTYNRHPLYSFSLDKRAGQTNGQGQVAFGGTWHAVSAKGTAVIVKAPPTTTTTTGTTTTSPTVTYKCPYPPC